MFSHHERWVVRLAEGDPSAYEYLFDTYYSQLCGFAFKYLEDKCFSEDVVQDIFYEIWAKRYHFEDIAYLKTFLYRSVRNRSLDVLRRRKIQSSITFRAPEEEQDFFLNQILEKEIAIFIKQEVDLLPDMTRKVIELSLLGFDNSEIASKLAITLDSVKARKKRGKQTLGERLKKLSFFFDILF